MKISLNLHDRYFPKKSQLSNDANRQLIPEDAKELVIKNFDYKKCCSLVVNIFSKNTTEFCTQTGIRGDISILLKENCRHNCEVEVLPDGLKDETINFEILFR
jgi:hypothetical protein